MDARLDAFFLHPLHDHSPLGSFWQDHRHQMAGRLASMSPER